MTIVQKTPHYSFIICDLQNCAKEIEFSLQSEAGLSCDSAWVYTWSEFQSKWLHFCPVHSDKMNVKTPKPSTPPQQGTQSAITTCFWRLDPDAMLALGAVLAFGENKYQYQDVALGDENWRLLAHRDHIDHAMEHLVRYLKEIKDGIQPNDEDAGQHLQHAFCRLMFALGSKNT